MSAVFEVDRLSVALLVALLVVLGLVKYLQQYDQPLLHPLILARQADASQTRSPGESATYRNVNAPLGFDLAMRPQRSAPDVPSLLRLGVTGEESEHSRRILDMSLTNTELRQQAAAFGHGIHTLLQGSLQTLVVYGRFSSARSIIALLSATVADLPWTTLYVPDGAQLSSLPAGVELDKTAVVCVDASAPLPPALARAVLSVVRDSEQLAKAPKGTRVVEFDDVLGHSADHTPAPCDRSQLRSAELDEAGAKTFALFYDDGSRQWTRATHTSLTSGVTAWLSEYPPEKIPGKKDTILTDAFYAGELPAPAYVALVLTALYTGAGFASEAPSELLDLVKILKPTLLYLTKKGAECVEQALWLPSTGSVFIWPMRRLNMYALRSGRVPRDAIMDRILCAPLRRAIGVDTVRSVFLLSNGCQFDQGMLDQMRLYLAVPTMHTYLPSYLNARGDAAVVTAPVAASNMYDLQAFAPQLVDFESARRLPPHVGPPSVSMELKLVANTPAVKARAEAIERIKFDEVATRDDPVGEVYVRGYALAHVRAPDLASDTTLSDWFATGDVALVRTNGTMVLIGGAGAPKAGVAPDITLDSSGGKLPTLKEPAEPAPAPAPAPARKIGGSRATAPLALAMVALCALPGVSAHSREAVQQGLMRRATPTASENNTMINLALNSLLTSQRASWEQGVTQSAILETYYPEWSVFKKGEAGKLYPARDTLGVKIPAQLLSLAFHSIASQDASGRLASVVTGDEVSGQGASQDSASCGEGVLIGAWIVEGFTNNAPDTNGYWGGAAKRQLDYLQRNVSKSSNGALSQRAVANQVQLWSDTVYMGPPFFAQYGLMTNNRELLQYAYTQVELLHNALALPSGTGKGLWGHILNYTNVAQPRWIDQRAWLTGNAWAAAGMLRVLAALEQSTFASSFSSETDNIKAWIDELLSAAYNSVDASGLLHNVVNDTRTFLDGSGSALLAYSVFRLGSMDPSKRGLISHAETAYGTLQNSLDPYGSYTNDILTVNELNTNSPGATSTESLAFLALLAAARRDYYAGNTTGSNGTVSPPKEASGVRANAAIYPLFVAGATLGAAVLAAM